MAKRKSRKNKVGSNDLKANISQLLDARINKNDSTGQKKLNAVHKKSNTKKKVHKKIEVEEKLNQVIDKGIKHASLLKQFDHIINEFNQRSAKSSNKLQNRQIYADDKISNKGNKLSKRSLSDEIDDNDSDTHDSMVSKRKLRKLSKPSLLALKESVIHPEIIEWYDCDSKDPFLLAVIKSTKNIVPIPKHWQFKREYLSGRSLLNKKPFELPNIIKQTEITKMRETLPPMDDNDSAGKSIKELSRAKVQPKLGALDIDFKKMYNIFFKLGATWKPDLLLRFGDQFYENRNISDEANWLQMKKIFKPGKISTNLRTALGLQEGQLPSWCMEMNKIGLPPSYPNFKIAGINWDISNLNNDTYGTWKSPKDKLKSKRRNALFGKILNFVDDNDKYDSGNESEIEQGEVAEEAEEEAIDDKEMITEYIDEKKVVSVELTKEEDESDKKLYTVLEETRSTDVQSTIGYQKSYSLDDQANQDAAIGVEAKNSDDNEKDTGLQKFKF